jgi:hypothetical protein
VRIRLADVEPAPDVFAAVMATGILSIAASKHHYAEISESLGSLAAVGLVVLIALVSLTGAAKRWDLTDPDVTIRLFTFVAACAVLDSRLTTPRAVVVTLGVVALLSWLVLIGRTVAERQDRDGFEPDTWILMGGLAIATLAGDNIHGLAPAWLGRPVLAVTVVTWVVATLWMPPLVYFGLRRISRGPERLHFAGVWWAFVFPPGHVLGGHLRHGD